MASRGPADAMTLPHELEAAGFVPRADGPVLPVGLLNWNTLVEDRAGRLYCLRVPRPGGEHLVVGYLGALYAAMIRSPVPVRLRGIPAQAEFARLCESRGLAVPVVVAVGTDWMLSRYVEGRRLSDTLADEDGLRCIGAFLEEMFHAHRQGIVLADRWGGNEIVRRSGRITFLDFDVDTGLEPDDGGRELDLAVALRTCLLWSGNKQRAVQAVASVLATEEEFSRLYDREVLAVYLGNACAFYAAADAPSLAHASPSREEHAATNVAVRKLLGAIAP